MSKRTLYLFVVLIVISCLAFSCASFQKQVALDEGNKEHVVEMKVSNFKFVPNNILTHEGSTIIFRLTNVTSASHNFTLTDPSGAIVQDVAIPGDRTIEVKATFSESGTYYFYCDKLFHSALGMKGWIEVVRK